MLKDTLLYLAQNRTVRDFVISNRATRGVSHRFVAGESLDEAIQATRVLNQRAIRVSLDHLGENVSDEKEALASTEAYSAILDQIKQTGIDGNISIKLTALGLDISEELCEQNVRKILEHASRYNIFVRIDMEGSDYTERTVETVLRMHKEFPLVGTVIQSCLYRSQQDVERLIAENVRVRLVKGAYKEPASVAYQEKSDVDRNFVKLMYLLMAKGNYAAIASHDQSIIDAACKYALDNGIDKSTFEFQMLYGIRRDLQTKLVDEGYNMRVYVPYGSQWYPYLMRRMAERPANLVFVMSNIFR